MRRKLERLRGELRTREANGEGTDVRLALLEAITVGDHLHTLDRWVAGVAQSDDGGLALAGASDCDARVVRLEAEWLGFDLENATLVMREVCDTLDSLTPL